jgi:uncharacterized protein (TIGR00255 family)
MIRSMTGYGAAETELGGQTLRVEIHSVNHRFSEVAVRLPRALSHFEPPLRHLITQALGRGKITFSANWEGKDESTRPVRIDTERARRYMDDLRRLKSALKLNGEIDLTTVLALPDVVVAGAEPTADDQAWVTIEAAARRAASDLITMRESEGKALTKDFEQRLDRIEEIVKKAEERGASRPAEAKEKLLARLKPLLDGIDVDPQRLAQEVAFHAERLDITEECVRLRAHLSQFRALLADPEPAGRKLNFLLQEMNREANTTGSKSNDADLGALVIDLKDELEKIREQVQNVE